MLNYQNESANMRKIQLPCEMNEDLYYEVVLAVFDKGYDLEEIADVDAFIQLHISRDFPGCSYILKIKLNNGRQIEKHVVDTDFTLEQYESLAEGFFAAGAKGLEPHFAEFYKRRYAEIKNGI